MSRFWTYSPADGASAGGAASERRGHEQLSLPPSALLLQSMQELNAAQLLVLSSLACLSLSLSLSLFFSPESISSCFISPHALNRI